MNVLPIRNNNNNNNNNYNQIPNVPELISNPLEIYDEITKAVKDTRQTYVNSMQGVKKASKVVSPLKISYLVQDRKLIVSFQPNRILPIEFTCALQREDFLQELTRYFLFDNTCCDGGYYCKITCPPEPHQKERTPFDVGRFSLAQQPLKGWKTFSRTMYDRNRGSCTDVIVDFLKNPEYPSDTLKDLFLAPDQIDNRPTEKVLPYFRDLQARCVLLPPEEKQQVTSQFQSSYPVISDRVFAELVQQSLAQHQAKNPDIFANLLQKLNDQVYGQPEATHALAGVLASQKQSDASLTFLFVGPSGVGKTELAKAVSKNQAGKLVTIAMNQYQSEIDITKFFGSGTGYVGSTDEPHFMKALMTCNPVLKKKHKGSQEYDLQDAVILFDELEKAHSVVKQSLLTMLDEGYYTASYTSDRENITRKFNFKKCVIIGTSNLFKAQILQAFIQGRKHQDIATLVKTLNRNAVNQSFSDEFLGRFEIIPFGPIPKGDIYQRLLKNKLHAFCNELKTTFGFRTITIENESLLLASLEQKLYGDGTQIREVTRYLERISKGSIPQHKHLWGDLKNVQLTFYCEQNQPAMKVIPYVPGFDLLHNKALTDMPLPN